MKSKKPNNEEHYIHRVSYNHRERMVGLFVFSALLLFAMLLVIGGKSQHLFEQRVTFYIDVKSSEGINYGNAIKLLGTEVGKVTHLSLHKSGKVHVGMELYKSQQFLIREDAKVIVNRLITLGNALIEIDPGSMDAALLEEGATLPVEETPSLNDLVLSIARIVQSTDQGLLTKFEEILPDLQNTIANIQKIISQIATGKGTLGAAVFDQGVEKELRVVVESGAKILTEAQGLVGVAEQRLVELEPLINSTHDVMKNIQQVTTQLPNMVTELQKTIALTHSALTLINAELQQMPGIVLDARRTLNGADQLLEGAQTSWPLSTLLPKQTPLLLIPVSPDND